MAQSATAPRSTDRRARAGDPVDQRRDQMLRAAAELIAERGFSETRIADVASRVDASSALVIYYFNTKDELLTEALRYSENSFYEASAEMLARTPLLHDRLEMLVRLTCVPRAEEIPGSWGLWFDLWAQAFRHPQVAKDRLELDARWRDTITRLVEEGIASREIPPTDAQDFAVTWSVLLDGLSIQVALDDPVVTVDRAFDIAMTFAVRELGLTPRGHKRGKRGRAKPHRAVDAAAAKR
jgi:AcrR family transcriptional regulator